MALAKPMAVASASAMRKLTDSRLLGTSTGSHAAGGSCGVSAAPAPGCLNGPPMR